MKILMLKDLKKVGKKGEVVNVSDGYGANYIIHKAMEEYITKKQKELMLKKKNKKLLN